MRRKQQIPKLAALMLIPILALTILGTAYSHWQQTLTITGTITTGNCDIDFSKAWVKCTNAHENTVQLTWNEDEVALTATEVFRLWKLLMGMHIENTGTLPIKITTITVATDNETMFKHLNIFCGFFKFMYDLPIIPDSYPMLLKLGDNPVKPNPVELQPKEKVDLGQLMIFDLHDLCNPIPKGETFTVTITITAVQDFPTSSWSDSIRISLTLTTENN